MDCPRCKSETEKVKSSNWCPSCQEYVTECVCAGCQRKYLSVGRYGFYWHDHHCDEKVINRIEGTRSGVGDRVERGRSLPQRLYDGLREMEEEGVGRREE
jgi:hypothetical protein